jgi:hypothetical protein
MERDEEEKDTSLPFSSFFHFLLLRTEDMGLGTANLPRLAPSNPMGSASWWWATWSEWLIAGFSLFFTLSKWVGVSDVYDG